MFRYSELGPQFQIFSECLFEPSMIIASQRNSTFVKGGLEELLLFIMLITALNLLF